MNIQNHLPKLLLLTPLALLLTAPSAQKAGTKIAVVNVQKVLAATPGGADVAALRKQADADLKKQSDAVRALQQKVAGGGTAADRQALDTATKTFNAANAKYQQQIQAKFEPVSKTVNAAVAAAAKAQGYGLVFDGAIAQQTGLVIYADLKSTDLTDSVIKQLKK